MAFENALKIRAPLAQVAQEANYILNAGQYACLNFRDGGNYLNPQTSALYTNDSYICYWSPSNVNIITTTATNYEGISAVSRSSVDFSVDDYARNNTLNFGGVVGYVQFKKVGEYLDELGFSGVCREFCQLTSTGFGRQFCFIDSATKYMLNQASQYINWVIPQITWYKGADIPRLPVVKPSGVTGTLSLYPCAHLYSGSVYNVKNAGTPLQQLNLTTFSGGAFTVIKPPYFPNDVGVDQTTRHAQLSPPQQGFVYIGGNGIEDLDSNHVKIAGGITPYHMLGFGNATAYNTACPVFVNMRYSAENIPNFPPSEYSVGKKVGTSRNAHHIAAYPDKETCINYFADYGIVISEDINDVISNPDLVPNVSINPDSGGIDGGGNVNIPSYPDNSTESVNIAPPDYTASSFSQCLLYNPVGANGFFEWIANNTFWEDFARLTANPIDAIVAVNMYNFDVLNHDPAACIFQNDTSILNVTKQGLANHYITNGYNCIINGGSYKHVAYYGNFADYTNYTYQVFIPYVGTVDIAPSDCVNKTLTLNYAVDIATGSAAVFLRSDGNLIYTTTCQLGSRVPLQASDVNSQTLNNTLAIIGGIGGIAATIATAGAAAPLALGIGGTIAGTASNLDIETTRTTKGTMSNLNSFEFVKPFLQTRRNDLQIPDDYKKYYGETTTHTLSISALGSAPDYIQGTDVYLISATATDTEKREIIALINGGIFI